MALIPNALREAFQLVVTWTEGTGEHVAGANIAGGNKCFFDFSWTYEGKEGLPRVVVSLMVEKLCVVSVSLESQ